MKTRTIKTLRVSLPRFVEMFPKRFQHANAVLILNLHFAVDSKLELLKFYLISNGNRTRLKSCESFTIQIVFGVREF